MTKTTLELAKEMIEIMKERRASYEPTGKKTIHRIVEAFKAITGHDLTPREGYVFLMCLKAVRAQRGLYKEDSFIDGAAYFLLAGEEGGLE